MKTKKIILRIIYILLIILAIFSIVNKCVYGVSLPSNMSDIYNNSDPTVGKIGGQVIWVIQIIFYAAAVIIVMLAGVKYMAAAPEAKAEFKKKMAYMVTGAIILFAAGSLVRLIGGIAMDNI